MGEDVTHLSVGDHVAWAGLGGGYAEQVALPAKRLVPVPSGISLPVAGAAILQGMTAHYLVTSTYPVREGDIAVVHAAAGGVGLLLTQMVKQRGGIVVATTSGGEKAELARGAGADHITGYDDFRAVVDEVTDGAGAHVVYDGVGQATFDDGLAALRPRGMMVLYGAASGQVPPLDPQRLNSGGSLFLTRPTLVHYIADVEELRWRATEVFDWIAKGELDVRIGGTYPLADAPGRRKTWRPVVPRVSCCSSRALASGAGTVAKDLPPPSRGAGGPVQACTSAWPGARSPDRSAKKLFSFQLVLLADA